MAVGSVPRGYAASEGGLELCHIISDHSLMRKANGIKPILPTARRSTRRRPACRMTRVIQRPRP
jgi:hypothetical protein